MTSDRLRSAIVAIGLTTACIAAQWNIDLNHRVDLRIYLRAIASADDGHLYDYGTRALNFLYPPFAALALRPLGWIPENVATRVWLAVSVLIGVAAIAAMARSTEGPRRPSRRHAVVIASAAVWSVPTFLSFRMGQINPVIAALVCLDAVLLTRRSRWGGIATGLAAALKVTPLVLVLACCWARPRDGARALATFVGTIALTAVIMPAETLRFWTNVVVEAGGIGEAADPFNATLSSIVGVVVHDPTRQRLGWIAVVAVVSALAWVGLRRRFATDAVGAVVVVMNLATIASPLAWVHHHWFATIALVVWLIRASTPWQWAVAVCGAVALVDPLALGEHSMLRTAVLVAFATATVVALPGRSDFRSPAGITDNVPTPIEERASDVRPDPAATR